MDLDDPKKPEFASWRSYENFARRVRRNRRYVWQTEDNAFLDTVLATLEDRDTTITEGTIFYRAQRGIDWHEVLDDDRNFIDEQPFGYGSERMKPLANKATEGRANPAGIPVLYLASQELTAISEVRPWIGSEISVAQFKIQRELRVLNLSLGHGQSSIGHLEFDQLLDVNPPNSEEKLKAVWIDIDNAFSRPVTYSDDAADYVPTQILSELFKNAGYDAIVYRSNFGKEGYNIVLFNVEDAEPVNCAPFQVIGIDVTFDVIGNRWFSGKHGESKEKSESR